MHLTPYYTNARVPIKPTTCRFIWKSKAFSYFSKIQYTVEKRFYSTTLISSSVMRNYLI